jgi:hypothetical protein
MYKVSLDVISAYKKIARIRPRVTMEEEMGIRGSRGEGGSGRGSRKRDRNLEGASRYKSVNPDLLVYLPHSHHLQDSMVSHSGSQVSQSNDTAPLPPPPVESLVADNWQEATIILCLAVVALIYLMASRAGGSSSSGSKPASGSSTMSRPAR